MGCPPLPGGHPGLFTYSSSTELWGLPAGEQLLVGGVMAGEVRTPGSGRPGGASLGQRGCCWGSPCCTPLAPRQPLAEEGLGREGEVDEMLLNLRASGRRRGNAGTPFPLHRSPFPPQWDTVSTPPPPSVQRRAEEAAGCVTETQQRNHPQPLSPLLMTWRRGESGVPGSWGDPEEGGM